MNIGLDAYSHFLIVDVEEATCCDRQSIPRRHMETIEIGAVMVEAAGLPLEGTHHRGLTTLETWQN